MKDKDTKAADISIAHSVKKGLKFVVVNRKAALRNLTFLAALTALVVALTFGDNIGAVKVDYTNYRPYHEISPLFILKYLGGTLLALLLFAFWRGSVFHMLANADAETLAFTKPRIKISDAFYSGLRFLQFCMLAFIVFGIVAAALVCASVALTPWLWIAVAIYGIFTSVPLYVACYEYMLNDCNFCRSLKAGFRAVKLQWGVIFLRLFLVNAVVVVASALLLLPAFALVMGVYDQATAVVMSSAPATPAWIFVLEYMSLFLGTLLTIAVAFTATSVLRITFDETNKYTAELSQKHSDNF